MPPSNTTEMPLLDTFPNFSDLPPEIRFKVWEFALSIWTVCTAKLDPDHPKGDEVGDPKFVLRPVGPTFLPVAQSCKEARHQFMQLLKDSGSPPDVSELTAPAKWSLKPWFVLGTGVLFLDFANYHIEYIRSLPAAEIELIKHVVVLEAKFPHAISICIMLKGKCPNLHSVQMLWTHRRKPGSISLQTAKRWGNIARSAEQSQSREELDVDFFRDLYESFHEGYPRILIVQPNPQETRLRLQQFEGKTMRADGFPFS